MKFNYYDNESKLVDLFLFPSIYNISDQDIEAATGDAQDSSQIRILDDKEYIQFVKSAKAALGDVEEVLYGYYGEEPLNDFALPLLLMNTYSLFGYATHNDYLDDILKTEEHEIRRHLLHAMIKTEDTDQSYDNKTVSIMVDKLLNKPEEKLEMVRSLATTENHKWALLMMLESPKSYLKHFETFLNSVKTIFDRYLSKYESEIETFKNDLLNDLNTHEEKGFIKRTYDTFPVEILNETNNILISFAFPYSFTMKTTDKHRLIIWGMRMDEGFKKVQSVQEDNKKARTQIFKSLSDSTRYEVLKHIARGVTSTKKIAESLNVSSATISYHINAFITSKVIRVSKSKNIKFEVDYDRLYEFWEDFLNDLQNQ